MCVYVCVDTDALFHPALLPPLISISCARARAHARTPHTPLSHAHTREPKCMLLDDVIDKKLVTNRAFCINRHGYGGQLGQVL